MSKKIIAMLLALVMTLGSAAALAENTKHERVYVVADAAGAVRTIVDCIRLENADGLDELVDRTMLTDIQNTGGNETFTLDGETLTWKAEGRNIIWQGTSDKTPAVLPAVTITLDGETVTAADLKDRTGEAVLTVTYPAGEQAPALALSVLPLPAEGISGLTTENAAVLTETESPVLVGWAVPGADAALKLPVSFSASFHADHADLGWMMTLCSSDPIAAASREIDARIGGDAAAILQEITGLLKAMQDGAELPKTGGRTGEIAEKINELNAGLKLLDAGAVQIADGAKQVSDGAAALNTGLATLKENNDALNGGADQIFAAILNTASEQIAASGLAEAGIQVPALTAENYADVLVSTAAQLNLAEKLTVGEQKTQIRTGIEKLTALKEQLDQVSTFVTGLKAYTDGVAQASDGAAKLSDGAILVSAGTSTLQETGTKQLEDSILGAEKQAAEKLLPLLQNDLAGALGVWEKTKQQLADTGYDLRPEGMAAETAYIIRTDLK